MVNCSESSIRGVSIKSQKSLGSKYTLKISTQNLFSLREGKVVDVELMKNFLEVLRQSKDIPSAVQIIDFSFITCLTRDKVISLLSTEQILEAVKENYTFSSWFLPKPTFSIEFTVVPIFMKDHYSCFIIRTTKNSGIQLICCDSRYSVDKMGTIIIVLREYFFNHLDISNYST